MTTKRRITVYQEPLNEEVAFLQRAHEWFVGASFDQKWRVLSYLCVRYLNRSWALAQPKDAP